MTKDEMIQVIREAIKQRLEIETKHTKGRLEIILKLDGEYVSSDFIDYTDVFRVVEQPVPKV
jgi:hypothetical protein